MNGALENWISQSALNLIYCSRNANAESELHAEGAGCEWNCEATVSWRWVTVKSSNCDHRKLFTVQIVWSKRRPLSHWNRSGRKACNRKTNERTTSEIIWRDDSAHRWSANGNIHRNNLKWLGLQSLLDYSPWKWKIFKSFVSIGNMSIFGYHTRLFDSTWSIQWTMDNEYCSMNSVYRIVFTKAANYCR